MVEKSMVLDSMIEKFMVVKFIVKKFMVEKSGLKSSLLKSSWLKCQWLKSSWLKSSFLKSSWLKSSWLKSPWLQLWSCILTWQFLALLNSYSWWVEPLILKAPENVWCQKWLRLWFRQKPKSCWPIRMQSSSANSSFPKRLTSDMTRKRKRVFWNRYFYYLFLLKSSLVWLTNKTSSLIR